MTGAGPADDTPPAPVGDMAPIRILHAVGGMNRGGVETWLMHVLRRIDRRRFKMDFSCIRRIPAPMTKKSGVSAPISSRA